MNIPEVLREAINPSEDTKWPRAKSYVSSCTHCNWTQTYTVPGTEVRLRVKAVWHCSELKLFW
jgi:hypothetical protein